MKIIYDEVKEMKSKEDKSFMTEAEWKRFYKNINKIVKELRDAFGGIAGTLRNDEFSKAIFEINEYVEKHKRG